LFRGTLIALAAFLTTACVSSQTSASPPSPTPAPTPTIASCRVNIQLTGQFPRSRAGIAAVTVSGSGASRKSSVDISTALGGASAFVELSWTRTVVNMVVSNYGGLTPHGFVTNPSGLKISQDGRITTFTDVTTYDDGGSKFDTANGSVDCSTA